MNTHILYLRWYVRQVIILVTFFWNWNTNLVSTLFKYSKVYLLNNNSMPQSCSGWIIGEYTSYRQGSWTTYNLIYLCIHMEKFGHNSLRLWKKGKITTKKYAHMNSIRSRKKSRMPLVYYKTWNSTGFISYDRSFHQIVVLCIPKFHQLPI